MAHFTERVDERMQAMSKRVYFYKMKKLCKQLNALLPIKSEEDRDKLNALIADMCNSRSEYPHYAF